jgi:non-ribosomal peptide synthase protein (TIGR01720 family)
MVFEHRTPRALAAAATALAPVTGRAESPDTDIGVIPLTPIMRWWRAAGGPTAGFYQSALLQLPAGASESILVSLLTALGARHGMLRARLTMDTHGNETLTVPPPSESDAAGWLIQDRASTRGDEGRLVAQVAGRLDPVHRMVDAVWIDRGSDSSSQLLLSVHHLAIDGVSWRALLDDFMAGWKDAAANRPIRVQAVGTSFRSWAEHLMREASESARRAELGTWMRILSAPEPDIGWALDPMNDTAGTAGKVVYELPAEHSVPLLNVVPDRFRAGVDHVLLCALALAVREWRAERGTPSPVLRVMVERHGRHDVDSGFDLSRTVGWFTARHPAALDVTTAQSASEALQTVGYGLLRYFDDDASEALSTFAEPHIAFNYLGRFHLDAKRQSTTEVVLSALDGGVPDATPLSNVLDITALAVEGPDGLRLRTTFNWARSVLDESSVRRLTDRWAAALTSLAALANDPYVGGVKASELFIDIDQDELDALQFGLESD